VSGYATLVQFPMAPIGLRRRAHVKQDLVRANQAGEGSQALAAAYVARRPTRVMTGALVPRTSGEEALRKQLQRKEARAQKLVSAWPPQSAVAMDCRS